MVLGSCVCYFFFSSRRRHTRFDCDWSSDVCSSDLIEMGNTEMTKYMAAGAFTNITSNQSQFDNSKNWLAGMRAWGTYEGKLYGVPYYAGSRVITYRGDLFGKAGFKKPPKSLNQFQNELVKVGKMQKHVKGVSPLYVGGDDWYTALE